MSYKKIVRFGNTALNGLPVYDNDPLTYCLGNEASQRFNHGTNADTYGQNSNACQVYLAQRCAKGWDGVCDYAERCDVNSEYATRADTMGAGLNQVIYLTPGEILLRNTAMEKYRCGMRGCQLKTEAFNAVNPASPYISYYVGTDCVPEYQVDPKTVDDDVVMNKLLDNPKIGVQILKNIKNTMRRKGTLAALAGTRLGNFYGITAPPPTTTKEGFTLTALNPPNSATGPYVVPTVSGLVPSEYVDWWPTQYVDYWPDEYDGAWTGAYRGSKYLRNYGDIPRGRMSQCL